ASWSTTPPTSSSSRSSRPGASTSISGPTPRSTRSMPRAASRRSCGNWAEHDPPPRRRRRRRPGPPPPALHGHDAQVPVPVVGRPMLARACDLFRAHGAADIVVVRGYRADVLEARRGELGPGVRFVDNPDYRDNNILESLFCAEAFLDEAFYFTYADIV